MSRVSCGGDHISPEKHVGNPLWPILVETVHSIIMFPQHKAYTRNAILSEHPAITPAELATKLGTSSGEAMVILHELGEEKTDASKSAPSSQTK